MGWWPFARRERQLGEPPDYYREGLELVEQRKYHEALTSFRLALRRDPADSEIMQQMAVVYTHIGMPDEAVKYYQEAIGVGAEAPAAHYGLAFLFLRRGDTANARLHLRAFLRSPPDSPEAGSHIAHARATLRRLEGAASEEGPSDEQAGE